ncbi:MAG: hypothetical protein AAFY99_06485 [Pseudomonadota bacterium]
MRKPFRQITGVLLGYLIAAAVAVFFASHVSLFIYGLFKYGFFTFDLMPVRVDMGRQFIGSTLALGILASPGFAAMLLFSLKFNLRSYGYFAAGGVVTAALVFFIIVQPFILGSNGADHGNFISLSIFNSGAAGGVTYALFHRRIFKLPGQSKS